MSALIPATLAAAVLLTVHRNVRAHVSTTSVHASLEQSAAVFEDALRLRMTALTAAARADAGDPRFTALVMLEPADRDRAFLATLRGVGESLRRLQPTEVFDVYDAHGRPLVSIGPTPAPREDCGAWVRAALAGAATAKVAPLDGAPYQIAAAPMRVEGHVVGVLLLGAPLDAALATTLRRGLQGEVTFFAAGDVVASTLGDSVALAALRSSLGVPRRWPEEDPGSAPVTLATGRHSWLTLIRPIPGSDPDAALLYALQRANDAESAFALRMQNDMLLLGVVAVLLALAAVWIFSRQITRPVLALVRGARAMERGDFDAPVEVRNHDELGYLAERFRVMRERERAYVQRLRDAARVKSEFIGVASHELRTPISILLGYHGLFAGGGLGATTPEQEKALAAMRQCLDRLTRLAEQATQLAQVQDDRGCDSSETEIAPLVEQAIDEAVALARDRRVTVVRRLDAPLGRASIDPEPLRDALRQLVANGIRFTPDGGVVTVTGWGDDREVLLQITDTGIGMPPERVRALLDGETVVRDSLNHHSSTGLEFGSAGLGFGFAIARAAVDLHGGTIEITSTEGRGTTVTIRLSRAAISATARAA